jgi:K(+)-stimulated pyrophosphate-energized sodium pump
LTLSLILVIALGALSIAYGVITAKDVLSRDPGSPRMQEIALAIQEGAFRLSEAAIRHHRHWSAWCFSRLWLGGWALRSAIGFAIGAILSGVAGFIGMNVSVRANLRTAQAATQSLAAGLDVAFKSGAITGMLVAGLALLGRCGLLLHPERRAGRLRAQ